MGATHEDGCHCSGCEPLSREAVTAMAAAAAPASAKGLAVLRSNLAELLTGRTEAFLVGLILELNAALAENPASVGCVHGRPHLSCKDCAIGGSIPCGALVEGLRGHPPRFHPGAAQVQRHNGDHVDVTYEGVRLCYRRRAATPSVLAGPWWLNEIVVVAPGAHIDSRWIEAAKADAVGHLVREVARTEGDGGPIRCPECDAVVVGRGIHKAVALQSVHCHGGHHELRWVDGSRWLGGVQ